MLSPAPLPPGVHVFERGWLSSNNILLTGAGPTALVDTGYCTHAAQTLALVERRLSGRVLDLLLNTHLHSDHCGGNAALQAHYPAVRTLIPPGESEAIRIWDEDALSFRPTGQLCAPFHFDSVLQPGSTHRLGDHDWEIHAAPGHDAHSLVLFEPASRTLISADALWQNGFGVVFPEVAGENGFDEVSKTLDLIEDLSPRLVIPGHGPVFEDVSAALLTARRRLDGFVASPEKHARHAAKVLIKFKLLERQSFLHDELKSWAFGARYLQILHRHWGQGHTPSQWLDDLLLDLARSGAVRLDGAYVHDA